MKLPTILKRDKAGSLQKAVAERDAAEAKVADLLQKRKAALADDDLDAALAIDK